MVSPLDARTERRAGTSRRAIGSYLAPAPVESGSRSLAIAFHISAA
jgi:hypothetical protein